MMTHDQLELIEARHYDMAGSELFATLANYFDQGFSDEFIRRMFPDGLDVTTSDDETMTTCQFRFDPSILSQEFMRDARNLHRDILAAEKVKYGRTICHDGWTPQ